jgi:hypothetical protein
MPSRNQMRSPSQEPLTMGFAGGSRATPEQVVNQVGSVTPEHFCPCSRAVIAVTRISTLGRARTAKCNGDRFCPSIRY